MTLTASEMVALAEAKLPEWLAWYRQVNQIKTTTPHPAEEHLAWAKRSVATCPLTAQRWAADVLLLVMPLSRWVDVNVRPYASAAQPDWSTR